MQAKDALRRFRESRFASPADAEAFVLNAGALEIEDALALFEVLLDRKLQTDPRVHKFRCALFRRMVQHSSELMGPSFDLRGLFVPMVRAAKLPDPELRAMLVDVLPLVNNVAGHREMVALFRSIEPDVRAFGRAVTEKIGGKTAFGMLSELCAQPDFFGRVEAMEACVAMAGYHAIEPLRNGLTVGTAEEKLHALELLGDPAIVTRNRDGALEAIAVALGDINEQVAAAAIRAFASLASEDQFFEFVAPRLDAQSLNVVTAVVGAAVHFCTSRTLGMLREQLLLGPKTVRLAVLETLEAMAHEDVLPVVAEALDHHQLEVRLRAARVLETLAGSGTIDVARTIVWLLRSRDVNVKRIAADLARRVPDPEGKLWPQLLRYLRDEDWWVRERITDALIELAGGQLTRHVVHLLSDESAVVRRYAVEMLMRLEDAESLGALVRTVQSDDDWWVRERAVEAIGKLGDRRAVPYIVDFITKEPDLRLAGFETLASLGDKKAAPHVAALIDPADADLSRAALDCLEALGDTSQTPRVMPLTDHPNYAVRSRAREVVRRWNLDAEFNEWDGDERMNALDRMLWAMVKAGGDDLLLGAGRRPYIKRMGETTPLVKNTFSDEQLRAILYPQLSDAQITALEEGLEDVDFSYEVKSAALRFRANVLRQHSGIAAVFRVVRNEIPAFEDLGLPPRVGTFGDLGHGLVLVGGPTGSGKSTTLAAIIDYINRTYRRHIITLEDPIEVIHSPKSSLVNQRELGSHSVDFRSALRSTLREDPDVILVGEMRDIDTISFAISAAETGHLVFGTVHTTSADTSVDRIINAFPVGKQPQVRSILASSLRAVVCQYLVPRKDDQGRVPAVEVMINSEAIANLIRKGKTYQIPNVIATSRELGMQAMDTDLVRLVRQGVVAPEEGYMRAVNKKDFEAVVAELESRGSRTLDAISGARSGSASRTGNVAAIDPTRQGS